MTEAATRCCAVCAGWDAPGVNDDPQDPLISCISCDLWVHLRCYGTEWVNKYQPQFVKSLEAKQVGRKRLREASHIDLLGMYPECSFQCALCASGVSLLDLPDDFHENEDTEPFAPVVCTLCSLYQNNRAMKPVTEVDPIQKGLTKLDRWEGDWAHISCALWIPEAYFWETEGERDWIGGTVEALSKSVDKTCVICDSIGRPQSGASISCDAPNCNVMYHVTCARNAGWELTFEFPQAGDAAKSKRTSKSSDSARNNRAAIFRSFCGYHCSPEHLRQRAAQEAPCEICGGDDDPSNTLICDGCDGAYHTRCFPIPIDINKLPEGPWFCPECDNATGSASLTSALDTTKLSSTLEGRHISTTQIPNLYMFHNKKINPGPERNPVPEYIEGLEYAGPPPPADSISTDVTRAISLVPTLLPRSVVGVWGAGDTRPLALFLATLLAKRRIPQLVDDPKENKPMIITVRCGEKNAFNEANNLIRKHQSSHVLLLFEAFKMPLRSLDALITSYAQFIVVAMQNLMEPYSVLPELTRGRPYALFTSNPQLCSSSLPPIVSKVLSTTSAQAGAGIKWLLESLTPRHQDILEIISKGTSIPKSQMSDKAGGKSNRSCLIRMDDLFSTCRSKMLVADLAMLRHHLVELQDHGIIDIDGNNIYLQIPIQTVQDAIAEVKKLRRTKVTS